MHKKEIEKAAEKLIDELGITEKPVPVDRIAEIKGLQVKGFEDVRDGVSGVLMVNGEVNMIGYNHNQSKVRQRFTIAHELGHFILHNHNENNGVFIDNHTHYTLEFRDHNSSSGVNFKEQQANAFAAALLMPEKFIIEEIKNHNLDLTDEESPALKELADKFNVSSIAMFYRLSNLNLFNNYKPYKSRPFPSNDF